MNKSIITEPWYRQFWPWFIFGLPAVAVIACFITLAIAIKHSDPRVDRECIDSQTKTPIGPQNQADRLPCYIP